MKLTKSYLKQIIAEELLPEGVVRINSDIDADFRGNMVQLVSSTGRLPLDMKSMRVMLTLIRQNLGYSYENKDSFGKDHIQEGKRFTLPNGIKIEMDMFKGIVLSNRGGKVVLDRKSLTTFLRAMKKQMRIV